MVYMPAEDSYLLKEWVEKLARGRVLDMGTGTGIQSFAALNKAKSILAVDIDPEAVEYVKNSLLFIKKPFEVRVSDLFSNIKEDETFDFIIFNPPYLPESKYDKKVDVTGGKEGWETLVKFFEEAKNHLNPGGQIITVFSSLTNVSKVLSSARELGYKFKLLAKRIIAFEILYVYLFELK